MLSSDDSFETRLMASCHMVWCFIWPLVFSDLSRISDLDLVLDSSVRLLIAAANS
jgi:hypothetical protein